MQKKRKEAFSEVSGGHGPPGSLESGRQLNIILYILKSATVYTLFLSLYLVLPIAAIACAGLQILTDYITFCTSAGFSPLYLSPTVL